MTPEIASTSLMAVTTGVGMFNSLCPPLTELRKATVHDAQMVNDVRVAEMSAVALTVSIGLISSGLIKSPVPAMLSVVAAIGLVLLYESVLKSQPVERKAAVNV